MIKLNTAEQLEVILDECIFTAQDPEMHSTATSVATEQIVQLIDSAITEAQQDRIKRNKSFCGCPMCTHHSEPYEAQLKNNTTKQEE